MARILIQASENAKKKGTDTATIKSVIAAIHAQLKAKGMAQKEPDATEWFGNAGVLISPLAANWLVHRHSDFDLRNALQNVTKGAIDLDVIVKQGHDIDVVSMAAFALFMQGKGHEVFLSDSERAVAGLPRYLDAYFTISERDKDTMQSCNLKEIYEKRIREEGFHTLSNYPFLRDDVNEKGYNDATWFRETEIVNHYTSRYRQSELCVGLPELDPAAMLASLAVNNKKLNEVFKHRQPIFVDKEWKNNQASNKFWELGKYLQELNQGTLLSQHAPVAAAAEKPATNTPKKRIGFNVPGNVSQEEVERIIAVQKKAQDAAAAAESTASRPAAETAAAAHTSGNWEDNYTSLRQISEEEQMNQAMAASMKVRNWEDDDEHRPLKWISEERQIELAIKASKTKVGLYQTDSKATGPQPNLLDEFKEPNIVRKRQGNEQPTQKDTAKTAEKNQVRLFRQ